jgi:pimeloyl-ACP methyl ester carboxylesterase
MWTFLRALALVAAMLFIVTVGRLASLQRGGPAHADIVLPGGIPGTLYLPGPGGPSDRNPFFVLFPPPQSARPPAVVLVHGFTADREIMSMLARKIAQNGYGVLAIDVRGHGANRNPFDNDFATESLRPDVKAAVDFMRSSDRVDGSRVVVMGHSMGAGATLDYASNDPNLKGAIMISGGFSLGPVRPKNALFIFAEHDPEFVRTLSITLAGHLVGVDRAELGKTYGDPSQGTAVEAVQLPGLNHVTILSSDEAAMKIVKWLDSACGIVRTGEITLVEGRLHSFENPSRGPSRRTDRIDGDRQKFRPPCLSTKLLVEAIPHGPASVGVASAVLSMILLHVGAVVLVDKSVTSTRPLPVG